MSEPINDGGPAFPVKTFSVDTFGTPILSVDEQGMTLRDYFAAKAMQGLLSQPLSDGAEWEENYLEIIATESYKMADEMLKARQQ